MYRRINVSCTRIQWILVRRVSKLLAEVSTTTCCYSMSSWSCSLFCEVLFLTLFCLPTILLCCRCNSYCIGCARGGARGGARGCARGRARGCVRGTTAVKLEVC